MKLEDFKLERFFAQYEFNSRYLLCCSDCETFSAKEILDLEGEEAYDSLLDLRLGYTESQGGERLRHNIASMYKGVKDGEVLVTSGAEEAIFIFMNTVLDSGDHVIVQSPCYQSLFEIARAIGCEVTKWEMRQENGWCPDLGFLADNIRGNTRAIIINSPHNPTGYLMSREELHRIVKLCRENNILLFSDEVYRGLEYDASDRTEAACDLYEDAVSLGVMSKTYGLAGLRIGWVATRNAGIYGKMASFKDYTSICNSAPSEFLADIALRHKDRLAGRNLDIIRHNLALLDNFFGRYSHLFSWRKPKAGPIAFPGIKWDGEAEKFCRELVNAQSVLLLPGNCYNSGNKNFRIGFGRKNMLEGITKLEEYLIEKLSR